MPFSPNKFVNPGQFGDYSSYSGLGADDQMKSIKQVMAAAFGMPGAGGATPDQVSEPAVPPQSFSEAADFIGQRMVAPIKNMANRFDQASQGNIYNALSGQKPVAPKQTTQQVAQPFSYQSAVEQADRD